MESQPRLLDQIREVLRLKHLSDRTEEAYESWVRRCMLFHQKRHPKDMGADENRAFLVRQVKSGSLGEEAAMPP